MGDCAAHALRRVVVHDDDLELVGWMFEEGIGAGFACDNLGTWVTGQQLSRFWDERWSAQS